MENKYKYLYPNIVTQLKYKPERVITNVKIANKLKIQGIKIAEIKDKDEKILFYYCYE